LSFDRRAFLKFASASPFVPGLTDLWAQSQDAPAWWQGALDHMKYRGRPGLVFVVPEEEDKRDAFADSMRDLLESGDSRAQEIFCSAVVICLHPEVARVCLRDEAEPGRTLVLDVKGCVIEKCDRSQGALRNPEVFEERFSKLIHGDGNARLAAEAVRLRARLSNGEKAALAELNAESLEVRERATRTLMKNAETLLPLLIFERRVEKDPERAARLRQIVDQRFKAADEKLPSPRLPFGSYFQPGGGCGAEEEGVTIQCGMAQLTGKGTRFLRFLTK
jgi:hypothetical protein